MLALPRFYHHQSGLSPSSTIIWILSLELAAVCEDYEIAILVSEDHYLSSSPSNIGSTKISFLLEMSDGWWKCFVVINVVDAFLGVSSGPPPSS